ncbi:MAG: hypothetical protein ICV81_06545 [Flavisolibacter sp.]|nr:hypothetical protein [Flavisolibacter sp.]
MQSGKYQLRIYPLLEQTGMPDSAKVKWAEQNQGDYAITSIRKMTANQYKSKTGTGKAGQGRLCNLDYEECTRNKNYRGW